MGASWGWCPLWFPSLHPLSAGPNTANKIRLFVKQLKMSTSQSKLFGQALRIIAAGTSAGSSWQGLAGRAAARAPLLEPQPELELQPGPGPQGPDPRRRRQRAAGLRCSPGRRGEPPARAAAPSPRRPRPTSTLFNGARQLAPDTAAAYPPQPYRTSAGT